jgi:hypothetical protein
VNDVVGEFMEYADEIGRSKSEPWPDYTASWELARFINLAYGDTMNAWYKYNPEDYTHFYTKWSHWKVATRDGFINLYVNQWLKRGSLAITGVDINGYGKLISKASDQTYHWVVITGISDQWNRLANKNPTGTWKWVRIFNPFMGQAEYYTWEDFEKSWGNEILRVDRGGSEGSCSPDGGYQCY